MTRLVPVVENKVIDISTLKYVYDEHPICKICGSERLTKHGTFFRKTTWELVQQYFCKSCGSKQYAKCLGKPYRMKHHIEIINFACDLIQKEYSSREISKEIKEKFDLSISNTTIWKWGINCLNYNHKRMPSGIARTLIIDSILNHVSMKQIAEETGVNYHSVKGFFRRIKNNQIISKPMFKSKGENTK